MDREGSDTRPPISGSFPVSGTIAFKKSNTNEYKGITLSIV